MPILTGIVNHNFKAVVVIAIRGTEGREQTIEPMVDTGFSGYLSLPPAFVATLGLPLIGTRPAKFANGTVENVPIHRARILWEGIERSITVMASGDDPLLGMATPAGYRITIEVTPNGAVTIEEMN
ncbi:MAG: clan AA aspartic protease [Fibrella sp.]|nr:clan AA aspartic protease [Armatimonadota bacterium]